MTTAAASDARDQQIRFLQTLFQRVPPDPPTYLELRFIRPEPELRDQTECEFFPLDDFGKVPAAVQYFNGAGYHVYFSTCPRRSDRGGKKTDVACIPCLWADCDDPESLELIKSFTPAPSIVVASGGEHKRHYYWILDTPLPPDPKIEELLRGIQQHLKADPARNDIASVLRLPGTKNPKYSPPSPCRVVNGRPPISP